MKGLLITGCLTMLATPAASIAQTSFNGTWKVDFNSALPKKVNVWLLQNGTYKCTSCSPIVEVRADGKDQPVKGQSYDTISVKIVDTRTVEEIEKKNGQVVSDEKFTVSDDGSTVTDEFGNWKLLMSRVEKAPTGAHELSGSWQPLRMESMSNGADAPYKGDSDTNSVALNRIDKNTIEEIAKLNGKVISVTRLTVAPDRRSITVSVRDLQDGSTNQFVMQRQ